MAAWAITKANTREVVTDNAGDAFGFAWCELKSIKWQDGRDKFKWPEKKPTDWPDDSGDCVVEELLWRRRLLGHASHPGSAELA